VPRTSKQPTKPTPALPGPPEGGDPAAWREAQRIDALLQRAQDGDPTALPAVRKILDADPGLWRTTGDLAFQAEATWLKTISGKDEVAKECFARKAKALRRELAGASASPLERLLAERIVLCWIAVHHAEIVHAQTMPSQTFAQGEYYQERLDRAQRRYLAAIRALATLRRLQQRTPVVQVNVAEKQVNVAPETGVLGVSGGRIGAQL
jgi:hypothetical protein